MKYLPGALADQRETLTRILCQVSNQAHSTTLEVTASVMDGRYGTEPGVRSATASQVISK